MDCGLGLQLTFGYMIQSHPPFPMLCLKYQQKFSTGTHSFISYSLKVHHEEIFQNSGRKKNNKTTVGRVAIQVVFTAEVADYHCLTLLLFPILCSAVISISSHFTLTVITFSLGGASMTSYTEFRQVQERLYICWGNRDKFCITTSLP